MEKKYTIEEIKNKFQNYIDQEDLQLDDNEYEIFCSAVSFLDKEIVDQIYKEVFFAYTHQPGFYMNFASRDLKRKKATIFLLPNLFYHEYLNKKEKIYFTILHEIAHHILGHKYFKNSEEKGKADYAANKLAKQWLKKAGFSWPPENLNK